jgi:hypothetical protein
MEAFSQLAIPDLKGMLKSIKLLQDVLLENDIRIVIQWKVRISEKAKSVLGVQLAAAFGEFGKINHVVCRECAIPKRSS